MHRLQVCVLNQVQVKVKSSYTLYVGHFELLRLEVTSVSDIDRSLLFREDCTVFGLQFEDFDHFLEEFNFLLSSSVPSRHCQ